MPTDKPMPNKTKLDQLIEEKMLDMELDDVEFLHGVPVRVPVETKEKIQQSMHSLVLQVLEEVRLEKAKQNLKPSFSEDLDYYVSIDGFNEAVDEQLRKIKQLTEVEA